MCPNVTVSYPPTFSFCMARQVRFVGYIQPHPLENKLHMKVQTNGEMTPIDAVSTAVEDLTLEVDNLKERVIEAAAARRQAEREMQ